MSQWGTPSATIGSLGGGNVGLGSTTLTTGAKNTNDTISGIISGEGDQLAKTGTGTLTLTGANTYTGGTTVSVGTLVARGSALGTGAVSVASGATLGVGQAANTTLSSVGTAQTLSISSLTVTATAGNTTPFLTFNLFGNGISDALTLTGTGTALSFSSAGADMFVIGFASGTGSVLSGTYTLITFANPSQARLAGLDRVNANNSFTARGTGNLAGTDGTFQWMTSGGNITGLQFVANSTAVVPDPPSLLLVLCGATPVFGVVVAARKRQSKRLTVAM